MAEANFYKEPEFETLQLHGGQQPDPTTNARAVPVYLSTSFVFNNSEHAAEIFKLNDPSYAYSRITNPTVDVFERRMALLEGGVAAIATSSGQSAQFVAIGALARAGDNIISSDCLYGGTYNQLKVTFPYFGVDVKIIRGVDPKDFEAAIDERTKAIFVEAIGNPAYVVADIAALAEVAHQNNIPLIVDNTFGLGGFLLRPIDHGADIVVHSATKWINGHGTTIAGVVIDSGRFDWRASGRFPDFTTPASGYDNVVFIDKFKEFAYAAKIRAQMIRDIGCTMSPVTAFISLLGLETLSLRAERHSDNAMSLANWFKQQEHVAWVSYLGLESHASHELAKKYLRPGYFCGMVNFGVKGDRQVTAKVVESLKLCSHLPNVGDSKTLVIHPASTTHSQMTPEEQLKAGITPDLIRISVGTEDIRDIIEDFRGAFKEVFG